MAGKILAIGQASRLQPGKQYSLEAFPQHRGVPANRCRKRHASSFALMLRPSPQRFMLPSRR